MANFEGVYAALPTFFNGRGELAEDPFREHVSRLSDTGVYGFVLLDATGQGPLLTREERRLIAEIAMDEAVGERVFVDVTSGSTLEALAFARHASDLGASALLVGPPHGLHPTPAGLKAHVETLSQVDAPLLLVSDSRVGDALTPESVLDLSRIEGVLGLVDYDGSLVTNEGLVNDLPEHFSLFAADPGLPRAVPGVLKCGAVVSGLANVAPEAIVALYEALCARKRDPEALAAYEEACRALDTRDPAAVVKHLLHHATGLEAGFRAPMLPLPSKEEERAERLVARLLRQTEAVRKADAA